MKRHDVDLMQHADGELDLGRDLPADARAKVDAVKDLGELVKGHLELEADHVPDHRFERMWRAIDEKIETRPASLWARIGAWFERYRGHILTGAVSAGAVAAIALVVRGPHGQDKTGAAPIPVTPAAYHPAEIESMDTPGGTPTVWQDEDGHTTVIWVTPDDTVEGI